MTIVAVCKYLVVELEARLQDTGKSHDVIETGYTFDSGKRSKKKYTTSYVSDWFVGLV